MASLTRASMAVLSAGIAFLATSPDATAYPGDKQEAAAITCK